RDNNCDEIQGYHLSKPIPPEELETFLRQWTQRGDGAETESTDESFSP
ncbi:MAG: hypothetical protein JO223_03370, partial [Hyphomicrobiales bacterium]|nr:hypothetical protein [Hyphomicrobiales bacterium]